MVVDGGEFCFQTRVRGRYDKCVGRYPVWEVGRGRGHHENRLRDDFFLLSDQISEWYGRDKGKSVFHNSSPCLLTN